MSRKGGYIVPRVVYVGMGQRIDDIQFKRNISTSELGRITGLGKTVILMIKQNNECRLSSIVAIANVLNVSLDWLVYGKEVRRDEGQRINRET